jgi:tRNA(fMet)-specific endonuclease VapC
LAVILADTDVLIDYLAGREPAAGRVAGYAADDRLQTTAVNAFELLSGAGAGKSGDAIRSLLAAIPVLTLDREAAGRAATVRRDLDREGRAIGMGDSLIAGIALCQRMPLLTGNRKHFERVAGLELLACGDDE